MNKSEKQNAAKTNSKPDIKNRPPKGEVNQVVKTLRDTDNYLTSLFDLLAGTRKVIGELREIITEDELNENLKAIPVEDINLGSSGVKVSALKNSGFNTVYDVSSLSEKDLLKIEGIGEKNAFAITAAVSKIKFNINEGLQVKLTDDRIKSNPDTVDFIHHLCIYMHLEPIINDVRPLYTGTHSDIRGNLKNAQLLTRGIWFFTSAKDKESRITSYQVLRKIYDSDYVSKARAAIEAANDTVEEVTEEKSLQSFYSNTAPFYALMEKLLGKNRIKSEEDVFHLPAEVIAELNTIELDLSLMNATLRSYQEFGTKYILNQQRVLLGDEMGLGKTMQAIACMAHLTAKGKQRFLVVCPVSVMVNWAREIAQHSKLVPSVIYGSKRDRLFEEWQEKGGVAVTTYESLTKLDITSIKTIDMMTVDEAHYIKNPEAARTRAIRKVIDASDYCLLMTGTPLENRVDEMIFLTSLLRPTLSEELGSIRTIVKADTFRTKIAPVYLRRVREDVLTELPEKVETDEWCTLSEAEKKLYVDALLHSNISAMRQVSFNVEKDEDSGKLNRILELVEEAAEDDRKIIIFSFFLNTIERIAAALGDRCVGIINGSISSQNRQALIEKLSEAPAGSVIVSQITAGGVGLNIQCASVVILCEPQWKPSIENQAISRCYRMGQAKTVMVHRLLNDNTIDEHVRAILKEKSEIFDEYADESEITSVNKGLINDIIEEEKKAYGVTEPPTDSE